MIVSFGELFKLLRDFMYFSREGCLLRKINTSEKFYYYYLSLGFAFRCFIIIITVTSFLLLLLL